MVTCYQIIKEKLNNIIYDKTTLLLQGVLPSGYPLPDAPSKKEQK
jgi:hypothetical protein